MIKLGFTITQSWARPLYTHNGAVADAMLLTDTADFRSKVLSAFMLAASSLQLSARLPSSDVMALYVDIESTRRCKTLFVTKNILDSLNRATFNDDSQIQSIFVKQRTAAYNKIRVVLYISKRISSERDVIEQHPLIQFEVSTPPVDYIIPTRKAYDHIISQNRNNEVSMGLIMDELYKQGYSSEILNNVPRIYINIETKQPRADLDNIGILYLLALDKLLYTDIESIDSMVLNLDRRGNRERVTVQVVEPGDEM